MTDPVLDFLNQPRKTKKQMKHKHGQSYQMDTCVYQCFYTDTGSAVKHLVERYQLPAQAEQQVKEINRERAHNLAALKLLEQRKRASRTGHPAFDHSNDTLCEKNANSLTKLLVLFLKLTGNQAERINTGGTLRDGKWCYSGSTKGSADISATIRGRSVKIEVKWCNDKMSDYQRKYREAIEAAGGTYIVCHSLNCLVNWYIDNIGPVDGFKKFETYGY